MRANPMLLHRARTAYDVASNRWRGERLVYNGMPESRARISRRRSDPEKATAPKSSVARPLLSFLSARRKDGDRLLEHPIQVRFVRILCSSSLPHLFFVFTLFLSPSTASPQHG